MTHLTWHHRPVHLAAGFIALGALVANAQDPPWKPTRPVELIVGFAPGGGNDITARFLQGLIQERKLMEQPLIVSNRPGGSGQIALAALLQKRGDPHFLLAAADSIMTSQLSGQSKLFTGIKVVTVAFKGAPEATIEVLAGRAHYSFVTPGGVLAFIKDGKLLALAVTAPQRSTSTLLPGVPALAETLPEFKHPEASSGLLAPAGTPRFVLSQISKEVARILELPDVSERLQGMGFVPAPSTPEEQDKIRREQIESLSRLVVAAGLRTR